MLKAGLVDAEFIKLLGVRTVAGDVQTALQRPDMLALTERQALRLFGTNAVVGKSLLHEGKLWQIAAVIADLAANTTIVYQALAGLNHQAWPVEERKQAGLFTLGYLACAIGGTLLLGLLSGIYPALLALTMPSAQCLAGRGTSESALGLWLRRALSVLQFASAMGLSAVTLALWWQAEYAARFDPGFNSENLQVLDLPLETLEAKSAALREQISHLPAVQAITSADDAIGRKQTIRFMSVKRQGDANLPMQNKLVAENFFQVYGIKPLAGRVFDPAIDCAPRGEALVLNLTAVKKLGLGSAQQAVGQIISNDNGENLRIVGVIPDVRFDSLREKPAAMLFRVGSGQSVLILRYQANASLIEIANTQQLIAKQWQTSSDIPLVFTSGPSIFRALYAEDLRLSSLLASSALVALCLAAFGIYVLAAYNVQRRSREIALRKLHGASRNAISRLLGRELLSLLGIAGLIGLPLAAMAIQYYLAGFIEHAPIGGWTLLCGFLLVSVIATLASLRHALLALHISPVEALRLE